MIGNFFFAMEISTLLTTLDPSHDFPYRGHIGFISQKSLQIMAASLLKVAAKPPRKELKLIFTFDFFKYFIFKHVLVFMKCLNQDFYWFDFELINSTITWCPLCLAIIKAVFP